MKYFFGENAHRPFKVGGKTYSLEVVSTFGGTAQGVLAVEDAEAGALLADGAKFVREIETGEYETLLAKKKRTRGSSPSKPRLPLRDTGAASSIKRGNALGAGVAKPASALKPATDSLPVSALDAVKVDRIAADAPAPAGEAPAPRASRRPARKTSASQASVASPDTAATEPAI